MVKQKFYLFLLMMFFAPSISSCRDKGQSPDNGNNGSGGKEEEEEIVVTPISPLGDYLVATDNIGRTLPMHEEVGNFKENRYVGLFYWLWHGDIRNESTDEYDVTKVLQKDPTRTQWEFADYYWAEPELGYYKSNDAFVLQKHLNLFCLLGIDFLYLDFTNAYVDSKELTLLLELILDMKEKGYNPPRLVPFLNHEPVHKIEELYRDFYTKSIYDDCWFIYEGKPLMLSPEKHPTRQTINNHFTWRKMWAAFEGTSETKTWWRFFDNVPMRPAYNKGKLEQIVVTPGFGGPNWDNPTYGAKSSTTTHVPTYDLYWKTPDTGKGLFFEEQWQEAHRIGAPILCITGWNEWKAGAWHTSQDLVNAKFKFQNRLLKEGESYFVDEFNEEFNRDLEPQVGEYTDNYFYQLAGHIRRYKGMTPMPKTVIGETAVEIDGSFNEWSDVAPRFEDFAGELKTRSNTGAPKGTFYQNFTARNDVVETRVTYNQEYIFFYVKTAEPMTSYTDENWMLLYIDSDREKTTGWEGYDFMVNLEVQSATKTSLYARQGGSWEEVAQCEYRQQGKEMEIAIPRSLLKQTDTPEFYFHWVDNIQKLDDINEFFVNGESAPERRYNYYYKGMN